MDVSSETQDNIEHDIYKVRIDADGKNITVPDKLGMISIHLGPLIRFVSIQI